MSAGILYLALKSPSVQTYLIRKIAAQLSKQINTKISVGSVDFAFFNRIILKEVLVEDRFSDTLFYSQRISAEIDSFSFRKKYVALGSLGFRHNLTKISIDSTGRYNWEFSQDTSALRKDTSPNWNFLCEKFNFSDARFRFSQPSKRDQELTIDDFNLAVEGFMILDDTIKFAIKEMNLNDRKDFSLNSLQALISVTRDKLRADSLTIHSGYSKLILPELNLIWNSLPDETNQKLRFDAEFDSSEISCLDLASFLPSLSGMDQNFVFSGRIYGNLDDLKGKNITIKTGKNTLLQFNFYVNGLPDLNNAYLFLDLVKSQTTFSDLHNIRLPVASKIRNLQFPAPFFEAGLLTYTGNFTGFLNDFVAFGIVSSDMGTIKTDLSFVPEPGNLIHFKGQLSTVDFQPGILFKEERIDRLSMNSKVDGKMNRTTGSFKGTIDGMVSNAEINRYLYSNIELRGEFDNKHFNGSASIDDPNLGFSFLGELDLNNPLPVFDFNLNLYRANLNALNFDTKNEISEISMDLTANFSGLTLDDLAGSIIIENGYYKNQFDELPLNRISLISSRETNSKKLFLKSEYFNALISGNYHFQTIFSDFKHIVRKYMPVLNIDLEEYSSLNQFNFNLEVINLDKLVSVFLPGMMIQSPFLIYGSVNSEKKSLIMEGSIPGISTTNLVFRDIFISNRPFDNAYNAKLRIGEIKSRNGLALYNVSIESQLEKNRMESHLNWTNNHKITYSGNIETITNFSASDSTGKLHVEIEGLPSRIYIADSLWLLDPYRVIIDSTSIIVSNFSARNNVQRISANGKISENKEDRIAINFEKIDLRKIETYLQEDTVIKGVINGSMSITDLYGNGLVNSDVEISGFEFRDQNLGTVNLTSNWDSESEILRAYLEITKNNRKTLDVEGIYKPSNDSITFDASLDQLSLVILETIIYGTFSDYQGTGTGHLKIHGTPDQILLDGKIKGENAGVTIDYTQVSYKFSDTVSFEGNKIVFNDIQIKDSQGNRGTFRGTITSHNFQYMIYDLRLSSPKILIINTTPKANSQFYGKVLGNGYVTITGTDADLNLAGNLTTLPGTLVNISLEEENEAETFDFLQFVNPGEQKNEAISFTPAEPSGVTLNIAIRATREARAQLIYNPKIGDMIRAQGEGVLIFGMDKAGNITLSGNYIVDQGDYLFTLQNVINKRFSIAPGGTIVWSGDPFNAIIDIDAIYSLKASLYDLLVNSFENISRTQRIPVECKILLTERLSNPEIKFDIQFPALETRMKDRLQQFFNTDEELNKQILSLLVLGKFYTPEYMRGTFEAQNPNILGNTASELFSNQLSNWLSQISNKVDIGFNYRPGNQITNDEIEVALSTQIFNDRVTINGNIGNNTNPAGNNSSELVGDFDISVKLTHSGKLALKAYNRSNNNLIYETAPYTQGIGISLREDFNSFKELLKKFGNIFRKADKK